MIKKIVNQELKISFCKNLLAIPVGRVLECFLALPFCFYLKLESSLNKRPKEFKAPPFSLLEIPGTGW
jgi:hypothetical protein